MTIGRPEIETTSEADVVVLALRGDFDLDAADRLRTELLDALARSPRLVIDMSKTTFMDSVILGTLIMAAKVAKSGRGSIRIAQPQRNVLRILRLAGLEAMLPIVDSVADALGEAAVEPVPEAIPHQP